MKVTRSIAETRRALAELPHPLGLVPTMGAVHEGHLALVAAAAATCPSVAASLFVNPTQFAPHEDYAAYPRDEARDLDLLEQAGVTVVFAPSAAEMYADGFSTEITVRGIGDRFEGAVRPQFFGGVVLVVTKLLGVVRPDLAYFGQKDAQQLAVVRRLVRDLDMPVEILGVPTVREADGLALSSRNAYLSPAERAVAPGLYRALRAGAAAATEPGATVKDAIVAATMRLVAASADPTTDASTEPREHHRFDISYVAVVDADSFDHTQTIGPRTLLVAAARLGKTRLIDNIFLVPSPYSERGATP